VALSPGKEKDAAGLRLYPGILSNASAHFERQPAIIITAPTAAPRSEAKST
jgi:hypothetical protein